jgi:hypothetical protein
MRVNEKKLFYVYASLGMDNEGSHAIVGVYTIFLSKEI